MVCRKKNPFSSLIFPRCPKSWEYPRKNHPLMVGLDSINHPAIGDPPSISGSPIQWIGLRENLQETIDFPIKYGAFLLKFSLNPIHWPMKRMEDPPDAAQAPVSSRRLPWGALWRPATRGSRGWTIENLEMVMYTSSTTTKQFFKDICDIIWSLFQPASQWEPRRNSSEYILLITFFLELKEWFMCLKGRNSEQPSTACHHGWVIWLTWSVFDWLIVGWCFTPSNFCWLRIENHNTGCYR